MATFFAIDGVFTYPKKPPRYSMTSLWCIIKNYIMFFLACWLLELTRFQVTSWDTEAGTEQTTYEGGRSFINCVSEQTFDGEDCDGIAKNDMGECRMVSFVSRPGCSISLASLKVDGFLFYFLLPGLLFFFFPKLVGQLERSRLPRLSSVKLFRTSSTPSWATSAGSTRSLTA